MKTQIDHGIFDYCGARVLTSEFLLDTGRQHRTAQLEVARNLGRALFSAGHGSNRPLHPTHAEAQ